MVHNNPDRRHVSSSIISRKTFLIIAFLAAILVILLQQPPKLTTTTTTTTESSSQEHPPSDGRIATVEQNGKDDYDNNDASRTSSSSATTQKQAKENPIRLIAILGERNSGTRWTFDHLTACYNDTIEVRKGLTRYKHWFQYDNVTKYPHDALVLAQFRNPYDWFKAMEHVPHHAPAHLRTKPGASVHDHSANNDWKTFLTKTWTMERYGADLELKGDETCQEDFLYRDIVSCVEDPLPEDSYEYTLRYSENQPFYEMRDDGSGLPYDNILELRTDKIRNFLNTIDYEGVADVWTLQYEYLVSEGTQHLLDRITELTGIQANCKAVPPQVRKPKGSRMIRADFAAHIRQHLNWTVESFIGYTPELKYEQAPSQWRRQRRRRLSSNNNNEDDDDRQNLDDDEVDDDDRLHNNFDDDEAEIDNNTDDDEYNREEE